jgi:sugar phosphate isomerase/epimerase
MSPRLGLMLYTLREACAADLRGTLEAVAALGYEGVELFDLHGRPAEEVRATLDEVGLACVACHVGFDTDLAALAGLGTDRVVLAWVDPPGSTAEASATVERVAGLAERAAAQGLRLGFHNHWCELEPLDDGSTLLERLGALPLWFELDLGWAWVTRADPVELLARLRGRCPVVHVKDFRSREGREFCPVGDGGVGYGRVLPAAEDAGVEWLLVEQDRIDGDPFEAVERSLRAVRRMLAVTV